MSAENTSPTAEKIVDDLLPAEFDWQRLVRSYPIPALTAATIGGFLIGRKHGPALVLAVSTFVVDQVARNAQRLLGAED